MAQISLTKLAVALITGLSLSAISLPVLAQTNTVNPLEDLKPRDGSADPFSRAASSSTLMDLVHRLQQGGLPSSEQFSTNTSQNIDSATTNFFELQNQRIQPNNNGEVAPFPTTPKP